MQATIIGKKPYEISFIISCFMTLWPGSSYRTTNPDFGMTGFLIFLYTGKQIYTFRSKTTLDEMVLDDPRQKQSGEDTSWSTGFQACKLGKGKKQVSASATRTVQVT